MFSPKYKITNRLLKSVSRIDASREVILNAAIVPAWERKFQDEALIRTVHYSTHIENNPLSYTQVSQIIGGRLEQSDVRIRDYKEIVNYREVLNYIDEAFPPDSKKKLSKSVLLKIHKILTKGIIPRDMSGAIRKVPVVLVNSKTKNVSYRAPEAKLVDGLLDELFEWYNSEFTVENVHPVIKSGILHTKVARIHPFVEANGRTSRVMATLSLFEDGYDIKKFFCLDEHYDRDLPRYYKALQSVERKRGDMTEWLEYFAEGLAEELDLIKSRVLEMSRDSSLQKQIGQIALTDRQVEILSHIQQYSFINNQEWRRILPKFSDDTILRDLKVLISHGLVKKTGKTKAARYVLNG